MPNEKLLYIEDANNKKLYYHFTPALIASNFVPLIVILNNDRTHFEYKMWNVLTPLYENEDLSYIGLLQELISKVIQDNECEEHIYLYGSAKGSYTAIAQAILCKANAVYVNEPEIKLLNPQAKENDLSGLLNARVTFPIFYLCDHEDMHKDEISYFVDTCKKYGVKYHLDRCIQSETNERERIKEVLKMFERMISQT